MISKFINLGLRESIIPLLISYMTDRQMKVKWKGKISNLRGLIGGSAQGTLLGCCQYAVGSLGPPMWPVMLKLMIKFDILMT